MNKLTDRKIISDTELDNFISNIIKRIKKTSYIQDKIKNKTKIKHFNRREAVG